MEKRDILEIQKSIKGLELLTEELKKSYNKKRYNRFNNAKKSIIKIQNEILGALNEN